MMSERARAPEFGRALPIKKKDGSIAGIKIYQFGVNSNSLDFDTGVLIWRRDLEDLLSGRINSGTVFENVPLPKQPVGKAK